MDSADQDDRRASHGHRSPGMDGDFDPALVSVRQAATVLILDERPDIQVLMLKRNARSIFVGDMWVFPGGAVDEADRGARTESLVTGWTDAEASGRLSVPEGGLGYWVAALRETFEEAGLLLAGETGRPEVVELAGERAREFDHHRDRLNAGATDFVEIIEREELHLQATQMHYVSQWVTPVGPPRRYDTRFFVTERPALQEPLHDDDEAVHHEWVRPSEAIAANETHDMLMMTPTIAMLKRLATFASVDEAIASARQATMDDDEVIRIRYDDDGPHRIAFPGDPDYLRADARTENGVISWPAGSAPEASGR